ncbi:MAG: cupin, partial [Halobacteria archaeon]|nr:cupin [Halobacteria archaeon]
EVEAGEIIRFAPGEFQYGYNDSDNDERVKAMAFGAPGSMHNWDDLQALIECRECGEELPHDTTMTSDAKFQLTCTECGNEFTMG